MEWQKPIGFRQWVVHFVGVTTVARVSKYERRISIPPLQVRRALSGGSGGCLCPLYLCENGDEVDFVFVPHRMHFFDCETEEAIVL